MKLPYWRLSNFYFFYFASLGALIPYFGLYLKSNGYTAWHVGLVIAVIQGTKIIAPYLWGWLADHKQRRLGVIRMAAFFTFIAFGFVAQADSLTGVLLASFVFSFFWNAMLPQFEALTFSLLKDQPSDYSRIRLWGSFGFVLAVTACGAAFDVISVNYLPLVVVLILACTWVASLLVTEPSNTGSATHAGSFKSVLFKKHVIAFLLICFLVQMSHGPYYSFFSIALNDLGYSELQIGQFWSLGVVAEIVLFIFIGAMAQKIGLRAILLASILLTIVRWLMLAWLADSFISLIFVQLLHAASFGAFHVVAIQLIHQYFYGQFQGRGQALYSSVGYGAGGMCGSLIAGMLWDEVGATWVFTLAAAFSGLAFVIAWLWVARDQKKVELSERDFNAV